jgi:hypothetical protein
VRKRIGWRKQTIVVEFLRGKILETHPTGRQRIKLDDNKIRVFQKHPAQTGTIRSSFKNVSIGDVEGQGHAATV